jgi:hypothetical protein
MHHLAGDETMPVHKLDDHLWVVRRGDAEPLPYCYDSRDTALRAKYLPEEDRQELQRAADARAGGAGVITYQEVIAAIAARRL